MLSSSRLEKYAQVLLWGIKTAKKTPFKKNDIVLLRFDPPGLRLAEAVYELILDNGFNPVVRAGLSPALDHSFYARASRKQLEFVTPGEKELMENLNASIYIHAPESLTHLSDIDPGKMGKSLVARKFLREITQRREEEGVYSWTLCLYPTGELSRKAGMSLKAYAGQVVKACYLDRENPVKEWENIYKETKKIKDWLKSMKIETLHIESENTDLIIGPGKKRQWVGVSGHNIPSFEIFLSPDWHFVEGVYHADQPSYRSGNYVADVRLVFKRGRVVESSAEEGEEFLKKQLAMDAGACRVGEFSLTDKRFSRISRFMANTLYDENFGGRFGNCHLAVGSSYADSYTGDPAELNKDMKKKLGFNDSALHWDLVNTENKTVTALISGSGKRIIYENGMFKY